MPSKADGTTGAQCYHAQCMGQMNFLNYQVSVQAVGSSEFFGLTCVQLTMCLHAYLPIVALETEPRALFTCSLSYIPRLL